MRGRAVQKLVDVYSDTRYIRCMEDIDRDDVLDFGCLHLSPATAKPARLAPEMDPEEAKALKFIRSAPFRAEALGLA